MNAKEAMLKVLADTAKELGKGEPVKNPPSVGDKAIPEDLGYELAKHHAQLAEKTDKIAQQVIRYKESEAQKAGVPELEEQVRSESDQLTAFLAQLEKGVAVFMLEKDKWATNLRQVLNPGTDFTKVTATMRQELELLSKSNVVADQLLKKLDDMLRSDNQDFLKVSPPPKPVSKKNLKKYEKETPYRFPEEGGEGKKAASWLRVAESAPGMLEAFWDSIEDLANEFGELIEEIVDVSAVIDHKLAGQEA